MTLYADKQNKKKSQSFPYYIPIGGHTDVSTVKKDEKGLYVVNRADALDANITGTSSDTLRIPGNTVNPEYMGGGPIETGQYLDEDTYEALTGLDQIREDRFLTKKGKRFHRKYNKQNK